MGNEASSLVDYNVGQPHLVNEENGKKYNVCSATHFGKKLTIFQYLKDNGRLHESFEKHIELLRTTRHPYILQYVESIHESKMASLITEHVTPLDVAVENQENDEIYTGLYNILEALNFLHESSLVCHNNLTVSSVFVNDDGIWKLAAFEKSVKVPRLSKQGYENDIKGYAEFALSVLEYMKDNSEKTKAFMNMLEREFLDEAKDLSYASLKLLLDDPFFKFSFLDIVNDLKTLPLKDPAEKSTFFRFLAKKMSSLPPQVVSRRFTPLLFSCWFLTDPKAEIFLPNLFASSNGYCQEHGIAGIYDQEYFKKYSLPLILSLYESKDMEVRIVLLKYLPLYADQIQRSVLTDQVLPEVIVGLKDKNEAVVSETFRGLADLVPILGVKDVVGSTSTSIFVDRKPDFSRTGKFSGKDRKSKHGQGELSGKHKIKLSSQEDFDQKQQKRIEREKQREEQRRRREERKKERQEAKAKRSQSQSSDEINGITVTSPTRLEEAGVVSVEHQDSGTKSNSYNSENEWEGFEALSNSSDSENKDKSFTKQNVTTSPKIKVATAANASNDHNAFVDNSYGSLQGDEWGWNDHQSSADILSTGSSTRTKSPELENLTLEEESNNEKNKKNDRKKSKSSSSLSLTNTKKVKSQKSMDIKSGKLQTNKKVQNNLNTDKLNKDEGLGNEFDIKISAPKLEEPDYFADMMPSMDNQKVAVIETKSSSFSSKFTAADPANEAADGWGDDAGDGWDDDDF